MTDLMMSNDACDDGESDGEEIGWKKEAESIVNEFKSCVKSIAVSSKLPLTDSRVYFNLQTQEGNLYCVELTASGFRICSNRFDMVDDCDDCDLEAASVEHHNQPSDNENNASKNVFYETMNALLDKLSPLYRVSFTNQLIDRLNDHKKHSSYDNA